jgi:hypothetical protein
MFTQLYFCIGYTLTIFIFHTVLKLHIANEKITYYALHCIINLLSSILSLNEVIYCFKNPLQIAIKESNLYALYLFFIFHLYHMLFFTVNKYDLQHHIPYVILPFLYVLYITPFIGISLYMITMFGIPGIIYYGLEICKYYNIMSIKTTSFYVMFVNIFIRFMFASLFTGIITTSIIINKKYNCIPIILLYLFNTCHYSYLSIISYSNKNKI